MPKRLALLSAVCCITSVAAQPPAQKDDAYQAIRKNDLVRLKAIVRTAAVRPKRAGPSPTE